MKSSHSRRLGPRVNARMLFLLIAAVYITGFFSHALYLKKTVYGDGIFYYSWLRSAVVDRDADFENEYRFFRVSQPQTPSGIPGNKYSIGPAMLWSPAYLTLRAIVRGTGYEFIYQLAIGVMSVLYALTGLVLLYRTLLRFFNRRIVSLTVIGIALATNLLFYGSVDAVNSHALSFFAASLFLTLVTESGINRYAIGAVLGLIGLIRPQDLIYAVLLLPIADKRVWRSLVAAAAVFLPQVAAWQIVYGSVLVHPYFLSGESFQFTRPHIAGVLFSGTNGLLLWSPILVFSLIGFLSHFGKSDRWRYPLLAVLCISIVVVASWSTWWQGASYGGRMFVSYLPIFAIGLGNFLTRVSWRERIGERLLWGGMSLFVLLNVFLLPVFLLSSP